MSLERIKCTLMIIDDFLSYMWVIFMSSKDKTSAQLIKILMSLQNEKTLVIDMIRSDKGTEFTNKWLTSYLDDNGIKNEFSSTRSP